MPFTPTTWVDGTTAITATELNRMETGIDDAVAGVERIFVGSVASSGLPNFLPSGWSSSRTSTGNFTVTFDAAFADSDYAVVVNTAFAPDFGAACTGTFTATFLVKTYNAAGTAADVAFSFILVRS